MTDPSRPDSAGPRPGPTPPPATGAPSMPSAPAAQTALLDAALRDGATEPTAPPPRQKNRRSRNVGWQSRDIIRATALVIAMYYVLRLLWHTQLLVFTLFLGVLFGLAVSSGVDRLARLRIGKRGIPRGLAAFLIVGGSLGLLGLFGAWTAPTLRTQSAELRKKLPEAVDRIEQWVQQRQGGVLGAFFQAGDAARDATGAAANAATGGTTGGTTGTGTARAGTSPADATRRDSAGATPATAGAGPAAAGKPQGPGAPDRTPQAAGAQPPPGSEGAAGRGGAVQGLRDRMLSQAAGARRFFFGFVTSTFAAITGFLLVLVIAIWVAADPDTYHTGLMHLFPRGGRRRAGEVLSAMAMALRKWLQTQLIAMVVIGAVTTLALFALGIEAALPLGILAGLLEFVPTVGPIISAIPAIAMGFIDSPQKALLVALVYVAIQQLENNLLIPYLMKTGVDLPPVLTIVAQALMAYVFGFIGLLVAVPMLAAAVVAVKMLYVQDVVGDPVKVMDTGDDDHEEEDDG